MKIAITGGAGFIGSHCADAFAAQGHEVVTFDRVQSSFRDGARHIVGDLSDIETVDHVVGGADLVVHAGGMLGTHETVLAVAETIQTNILGTVNVLNAAVHHGTKVINITKPNVWLNTYSITKDCTEKLSFMYVDELDAQVVCVKLYNVYGTRQKYSKVRKAIPTWIVEAVQGRPVEIYGSGAATVDLVHTTDVSEGIIAIANNFETCRIKRTSEISVDVWGSFPAHNAQVLELGSGIELSVNEAVVQLVDSLGIPVDVRHLPMRRGEIDGTRLCANVSRLTHLTGYTARVALRDGLADTIDWYKHHMHRILDGSL